MCRGDGERDRGQWRERGREVRGQREKSVERREESTERHERDGEEMETEGASGGVNRATRDPTFTDDQEMS